LTKTESNDQEKCWAICKILTQFGRRGLIT
jgi:hypothetical protein